MRVKLLRIVLPLLAMGAMAAAPASAGAVTVGISDNNWAMFSSPLFTGLHIDQARLMVNWNAAVERNHTALTYARNWIRAAQADGVRPLVSFDADPGRAGNHVPSVSEYTRAIKAFIRDFPTVKQYVPWNEPDWNFRSLSRHPLLAAAYYNALVKACGKGCTIVAGELYLDARHLGPWIRAYEKGLHYRPKAWALHPYDDIQGHSTAQIRTMLKYMTPGSQLWLTEISGVVLRGHWHGNHILRQSTAKQASDERFLFSLPRMFPRITRIYHYQWQATPGYWDSALLNSNGTARPAYYVLKAAAR